MSDVIQSSDAVLCQGACAPGAPVGRILTFAQVGEPRTMVHVRVATLEVDLAIDATYASFGLQLLSALPGGADNASVLLATVTFPPIAPDGLSRIDADLRTCLQGDALYGQIISTGDFDAGEGFQISCSLNIGADDP